MLKSAIEYVLVPDSGCARRIRRLIAKAGARSGVVVGTWAELVTLAQHAYLTAKTEDSWNDKLQQAVADLESTFWHNSFEIAPDEVVDYIGRSLTELLHASSTCDLSFSLEQLQQLPARVASRLQDLKQLHEAMDDILPLELAAIRDIINTDGDNAIFAIHVYHHKDVPPLTRAQNALLDKLKNDFSGGVDATLTQQLDTIFPTDCSELSAINHLKWHLFDPDNSSVNLDSTLHWLKLRDYQEEVEATAAIIQNILSSDATITHSDIGILLPDDMQYSTTVKRIFDQVGITCSGLPSRIPLRDIGSELLRDFIVCLQPPAPIMAVAALFSSPLLIRSAQKSNKIAQKIMDGDGLPDDNPLTSLLADVPSTPVELIQHLQAFQKLIIYSDSIHCRRAYALIKILLDELENAQTIDWQSLERLLIPQKLFSDNCPSFNQEGVAIFVESHEPWRTCRLLFVLGCSAGRYPRQAAISPVFSEEEIKALNTTCGYTLEHSQQVVQRRRQLFLRQLNAATEKIYFTIPCRDGAGEVLQPCETLTFMAQLFGYDQAEKLLLDCTDTTQRSQIEHLVYAEQPIVAPRSITAEDIILDCDLLALRTTRDGKQKPESPSGLEVLMISALAWTLYRFNMEAKEWGIDTLDIMTQGSLAHSVFEHLFTVGNPIPDSNFISKQIPILLLESSKTLFPLLERDEWQVERHKLHRDIEKAALRWREILLALQAQIVGTETKLTGTLDNLPIRGNADLILSLPNNRMLVVDYKKSGSTGRIKRMENCFDSQTNLYRIMMQTGGAVDGDKVLTSALEKVQEIGAMYYLLNDQTALSDTAGWTAQDIGGLHEMGNYCCGNAMELIQQRIEQLKSGHIELNSSEDEQWFTKNAGITAYALDKSPLVRLFMKDEK